MGDVSRSPSTQQPFRPGLSREQLFSDAMRRHESGKNGAECQQDNYDRGDSNPGLIAKQQGHGGCRDRKSSD